MARGRAQRRTSRDRAPASGAGGSGPGSTDRDDRYDRGHETAAERLDRNWNELLQELRVTQTGVQILTGFLLTLPFQERFTDLDDFQRTVYLVLVVLAVITTGLIVAPVGLHRIMFRKHLKAELVESADRLARSGLVFLALTVAGAALLVFDVVLDRTAAYVVGAGVLTLLAVLWFLVPMRVTRANTPDRSG